jgi:hypothetical protein
VLESSDMVMLQWMIPEYEVLGGRSYSVVRGFESLYPRYKLLHTSSSAFTV